MKLACVLLALALGGASIPISAPRLPVEKPAVVYLEFTDGSCSGVSLGPNLILSASHCFEAGPLVKVNGIVVEAAKPVHDGSDHALVRVTQPKCSACVVFSRWATLSHRKMVQGQEVHWWGHPGGLRDQYRRGYVMGFEDGWVLIDAIVYRGDSGSGIFDRSGRVVGVVSTMFSYGEPFHGAGAKPFAFTKEQLQAVGL